MKKQFGIPKGFVFSAVKSGLKASGNLDLALAEAPLGATAAAMFTKNRVVAAPVTLGRENLKRTRGRLRAVLVNAGNANCGTGASGYAAAQSTCEATAALLTVAPEFVLPSSTGVIGVPLPIEKVQVALPSLVSERASTPEAVMQFARAIMTTDTRPKLASAEIVVGRNTVTVLGIAKGSGMIHPNMATMLVYLFTDADIAPAALNSVLKSAVDNSFNRISVDGDTSTNDTVAILASGLGAKIAAGASVQRFSTAVHDVCASLAHQIVSDGEGVKHVVRLSVEGAASAKHADQIARTIAHSLLVKTAWAGADPNWGRILAAVGRSNVAVHPADVSIYIGDQQVCAKGQAVKFNAKSVHKLMLKPEYTIKVCVGSGGGTTELLTCDLTTDYVHINADYST